MCLDPWQLLDYETEYLGNGFGDLVRDIEHVIGFEVVVSDERGRLDDTPWSLPRHARHPDPMARA